MAQSTGGDVGWRPALAGLPGTRRWEARGQERLTHASEAWALAGNRCELRPREGRSLAIGVRDQEAGISLHERGLSWLLEVQQAPEDRDSFSSQFIKHEVSSPREFSLQ